MISRRYLVCASCKQKTCVRIGIGHAPAQRHSFECPGCSVLISFELRLDQAAATIEWLEPVNAAYSTSARGTRATRVFYPEVPVHDPHDPVVSPFLATFSRYLDYSQYQRDEAVRQGVVRTKWPRIKRLLAHYRTGGRPLFEKDFIALVGQPADPLPTRRRRQLAALQHVTFDLFTDLTPGTVRRLHQRCAYAFSKHTRLVLELLKAVEQDALPERNFDALGDSRDRFVAIYPNVQPLLATRYWNRDGALDLSIHLPDKAFDALRLFYIDCFELTCRLLVPAIALESIIVNDMLNVPYDKVELTVRQLYELDNGKKLPLLAEYPIGEVFVPRLDVALRNGLGHNSARHERAADLVVFFTRARGADRRHEMTYTTFCGRVLDALAALEGAAVYFDTFEIMAAEGPAG